MGCGSSKQGGKAKPSKARSTVSKPPAKARDDSATGEVVADPSLLAKPLKVSLPAAAGVRVARRALPKHHGTRAQPQRAFSHRAASARPHSATTSIWMSSKPRRHWRPSSPCRIWSARRTSPPQPQPPPGLAPPRSQALHVRPLPRRLRPATTRPWSGRPPSSMRSRLRERPKRRRRLRR